MKDMTSEENVNRMKEDAELMFHIIRNIYNDLPSNIDWLNPDIETMMIDLLDKHLD
jgi:hypothetical protein